MEIKKIAKNHSFNELKDFQFKDEDDFSVIDSDDGESVDQDEIVRHKQEQILQTLSNPSVKEFNNFALGLIDYLEFKESKESAFTHLAAKFGKATNTNLENSASEKDKKSAKKASKP